ncbi:amyloid-beta A4 precursor protein-binding family A member 2 isoform 2-T2 [Neosynchiropus ocellatus]
MAHRKRPGSLGGNSMAASVSTSCPAPHPTESCDVQALPPRRPPVRYPKVSHDPKQPPRSCKPQYQATKFQEVVRKRPEVEAEAEDDLRRYGNKTKENAELLRPKTQPVLENEQVHDLDDHQPPDFNDGTDSLDDDSSSDYINNSSDDEEDYDDGLAEEDEGVTYYIRYCPEDDTYMEGTDHSTQGGCNHNHHQEEPSVIQQDEDHPNPCQESDERWTEEGRPEAEVREDEWVDDAEADAAAREEWREEDKEVREEWHEEEEEEEEVQEEWREGNDDGRAEWTEGGEETREEWREGDEEETEGWREGDEEGREEWREGGEEGREEQEHWRGRERQRVDEWAEGEVRCEVVEQDPDEQIYNGRPEPILDHHRHHHHRHHHHHSSQQETHQGSVDDDEGESEDYCPHDEEEDEGDDEEQHGRAYREDYYGPEDNGNSVVPYGGRKVLVVEGETGEEAEEDIDQIVAEIKMSMSMGSLSSGTDQSPEELAQDPPMGDYLHIKPSSAAYPPAHHSHSSRPKSLNLPSMHHNNPDLQRSVKAHPCSPEDRQRWTQEQVSNGAEQPRKQQRSDLNIPLENNNVPEPSKKVASFPSFVDVPGPCEPEDLIDGIIFAANYLGSTQLLSERNPSKNIRMMQAQEAVSRVKRAQKAAKIKKKASADGDTQTLTEVDLFISTQRIKVLNADSQETMMDNALRTISYIADIGNIVVLMARRRMPRTASQDCIETTPGAPEAKKQYKMICHVFESEDAQLIAQSIGQAFSVAYQEFLRANGINPEDLSQKEYSDIINTQEMYNDDLIHFSNSENCKELQLEKSKGEILGVVIVESGWGSILPTVILANMMNGGPAARSGKLSIGDQIMSINNTSLVGLPLATCQGIIKGLKNQVQVKMNIVSCPPVTTVLIKRPDLKYQLGFSVQNGIICSLMRGGIAERGGVRVGHRIIEINGQSVVATAHEKIVQALSNSVGEIHMKTMPAAMFRLLTGQETPMYI